MHRIISISIIILFTINTANAQEIHVLDLQTSVDIAKQKSYEMRLLKQDLVRARYNLIAATNRFKTNAEFEISAPDYTETIRQWEDSLGINYFPVKQARYSGNLVINQPLPTDGRLFLSSGLHNVDNFEEDERSLRINTTIGFRQPIEAFYSYNSIKSGLKRARMNHELSSLRLKRAELDLLYEISQAFYDLVSAMEQKNIALQAFKRQEDIFKITQQKYAAGLIREVEALQMEVDLGTAQNEFDISKVRFTNESNQFKHQIGIPLRDSVVLISDLGYDLVEVDMQKAIELGLKNRLEIRESEIQVELSKLDIKRSKVEGQIRGNIAAYYDFIGYNKNDLNTPFSNTFSNSFQDLRNRPGNRGVSFNIAIPIWDWGVNKSIVKALEADLKKEEINMENELVSIERDIMSTVLNLKSSLRRLQLLEKNVKVAEKSFEISESRFYNGDIDSESLALDRSRLNSAYVSHLQAYIAYNLLLADLKRKTFYDFQEGRSLLEE